MQTNAPLWFEIVHLDLVLPNLAEVFSGFRVVQISDIHYGTFVKRDRLDAAVSRINELDPDLVVFTGDLISDSPDKHAEALIDSLRGLRARHGVIAVRGNHDHWTDPAAVARILEASGILHLENAVHTIMLDGASLHIAGLDCFYEGKDRLDQVLAALPESGAAILLVHEPDFAEVSAWSRRFDLQLSGHSHGGQLVIPRIGPVVLPRYARKFPLGLYRLNGMIQYTNRGIGTSHLRLRINCPAEVTLLTLHALGDR